MWGVVEQPGVGIVAVGYDVGNVLLMRYRDDGTLDPAFGTAGITTLNLGGASDTAYDVARDAAGRLIVTGQNGANGSADLFVARFSANGVLDTTFGTSGITLIDLNTGWYVSEDRASVAVDPRTGAIVVGAESNPGTTLVARLTGDGAMDGTFGTSGIAIIDAVSGMWDQVDDLLIDADESIIAAVQSGATNLYLMRLLPTGARDTSFGTNGVLNMGNVSTNISYGLWLGMERNGRVLAGGGPSVLRFDTATFPNYASGSNDWSTGSMFGACLRALAGTTPDGTTWQDDPGGNCTETDLDPWRRIPSASADLDAKIARLNGPGSATAYVQFGVRNDGMQPIGTYVAPIMFEVIAPNS